MAKKQAPLSETSQKVLEFLQENGSMTLQELKEAGFENINSSHLTALRNRKAVTSETVEKEVTVVNKRKVLQYSAVVTETKEESEEDAE